MFDLEMEMECWSVALRNARSSRVWQSVFGRAMKSKRRRLNAEKLQGISKYRREGILTQGLAY
jgi:hypothetical protein